MKNEHNIVHKEIDRELDNLVVIQDLLVLK